MSVASKLFKGWVDIDIWFILKPSKGAQECECHHEALNARKLKILYMKGEDLIKPADSK